MPKGGMVGKTKKTIKKRNARNRDALAAARKAMGLKPRKKKKKKKP